MRRLLMKVEGKVQYIVKNQEKRIPENTESFNLKKNIMFEEEILEPEQIKKNLIIYGRVLAMCNILRNLSLIVKKINILQKNQRSSMLKK